MTEPNNQNIELSYGAMKSYFKAAERAGKHLLGFIVFTKNSFKKEYTEDSRTYLVSSANKVFQPNMGGYSIYASSLDGSDPIVRLEQYMADERGGQEGWHVERCYMRSDEMERAKAIMREALSRER